MTREEAIKFAEYAQIMADGKPDVQEFYKLAESALRAQQEQTPCSRCGYGGKHLDAPPCKTCPAHPKGQESNGPLTLDELRKMDGEPVWVQSPGIPEYGRWAIVEGVGENSLFLHDDFTCHDYGKTWMAYRQKPEECAV